MIGGAYDPKKVNEKKKHWQITKTWKIWTNFSGEVGQKIYMWLQVVQYSYTLEKWEEWPPLEQARKGCRNIIYHVHNLHKIG